ncbi:MAG: DEAD/DEAH box helicase family protein [Actinobacteria bacterium]|nr:DEAD/DEAH box helicase family protein [Actinomycetota bacterium]
MAESLEELGVALGYNSAESALVSDFYVPCLGVSRGYDRAVGYFRSSLYNLVGVAISDFVLRGGHIRIVCSPSLEARDRDAIEAAGSSDAIVSAALEREIEAVLRHPENVPVVELLATLLAASALEIKIAYRPGATGIFHEKLGIFHSPSDALSFSGSSNETYSAWDPMVNHEGFETFGSWDSADSRRTSRHVEYFERLWSDALDDLCVRPLPEIPRAVLARFENALGVEAALERARVHLQRVARLGGTRRRSLQEHQKAVVANWSLRERGVIDHATGAGKTLSALEVMRNWLTRDARACAVVIVPGDLLTQQWALEVRTELGDMQPKLLMVGGSLGNRRWRERLGSFASPSPAGPRVVIATVNSAATEDFLSRTPGGSHLLLIADEVHTVGSRGFRRILEIDAGGRLGLSATPQRFNDPEGTAALFDYFGCVLPPPFGIPEALLAGRLVPYDYHVRTVLLEEDEAERYDELSRRIAVIQARAAAKPDAEPSDALEMLLIQRARVVKKARAKTALACAVVQAEYQSGDRWLLYCEDSDQLNEVSDRLVSAGLNVLDYHTQMLGDAQATLRSFQRHGGVLVSIRCLDQGVDIPAVDHALILASSTNPRQFIQRRGRVLRRTPGKYSADIYDLLVCRQNEDEEQVLNRDLERARVFAAHARNQACRYKLDALASALEDQAIEFETNQEEG